MSAPRLVTVFGGSGFLGAQTVRQLARAGWRVRVAVRRPHTAHDLKPLGDVGQIQLVRCDVRKDAEVEAALRSADAVINLVGVLYEAPGRGFRAMHVEAVERIARAAAANGIECLAQVSALGAAADSHSLYARTKAEGEAVARKHVPGAVIVRPSVVFGSGDSFLNRFAAMASISPVLPLVGGGETRFQPVFVGDVARAIAAAVEPGMAGRTFELGGPAIYSFRELMELILRETGRERVLAPLPFPVARLLGSLAQATALVGIAPPLTRDQVLLLERDNVVAAGTEGLSAFGITPTGLEAVAPSYLWLYRRGGQFAEIRPAA